MCVMKAHWYNNSDFINEARASITPNKARYTRTRKNCKSNLIHLLMSAADGFDPKRCEYTRIERIRQLALTLHEIDYGKRDDARAADHRADTQQSLLVSRSHVVSRGTRC